MKIVAIIQARMSSTRLPGKVLLPISGKSLLWYVVTRVRQAKSVDETIVATSRDSSDDPIVNFCRKENIACFRGSLEDVLSRYYHAAKDLKTDVIVRVTGDCPLIDGVLIDQGIQKFKKGGIDYLSNIVNRTYPCGFDFEIFNFSVLKKAYRLATETYDREHVTLYIYRSHPQDFRIAQITQPENKSHYRLTIDTRQDFELIKILIEKYKAHTRSYKEIINILDEHPELVAINKDIK